MRFGIPIAWDQQHFKWICNLVFGSDNFLKETYTPLIPHGTVVLHYLRSKISINMWISYYILMAYVFHTTLNVHAHGNKRQRRYLLFTKGTQWGVFATISVPLEPPESTVSMAWFFEANYYAVDNSTYLEPLLGDIEFPSSQKKRNIASNNFLTRKYLYNIIEGMLAKHGYHGRSCLLRAICENGTSHFLHNGVLGDILHLVFAPSTSMQEDLEDCYYEAEYWGLEEQCGDYENNCPESPLDYISIRVDNIL